MDKCMEDLRNLMLDIEEKKRKKEEIKKKALGTPRQLYKRGASG